MLGVEGESTENLCGALPGNLPPLECPQLRIFSVISYPLLIGLRDLQAGWKLQPEKLVPIEGIEIWSSISGFFPKQCPLVVFQKYTPEAENWP